MAGRSDVWLAGWDAVQSGQPAVAERIAREGLTADPDSAAGWYLLGMACHGQGRPGEAAECFRRVLTLSPDSPEVLIHLGNALQDMGRPGEAAECFQWLLVLHPDLPEAHYNLGNALQDQGRLTEAVDCYAQALQLRPVYAEALVNSGHALSLLGRLAEAAECLQRALHLRPDWPEAHNNLGNVLRELGRSAEALACYQRVLQMWPDVPEVHNNLGVVLRDQGRPAEAEACFRRALALRSEYPEAYHHLGSTLADQGRLDEALEAFRQALRLRPGYTAAHDSLLLTLHYRAGVTLEELAAEHAEYQRRHAAPLRATWRPHANDRDPERPLRLGFVSADLGRHPVGFLLVRAAEALACASGRSRDPARPTVIYYSDRRAPADEWTRRFQATATVWRDTAGLSDEQLAELVRSDGIDVLIDLAGHTAGNRLLMIARRPAPVQATWLGYPGTTGLDAIDYLIADVHQVPPSAEVHYRERVLRLPNGYASYDPPAQVPEPGPLPALRTGHVTFGCFNNPAKLSPPALAAFAEVLRRVPGSRLLLKFRGLDDPAVRGRLRDRFAAWTGSDRVELRGLSEQAQHLAAYREVDVALDPFPYAGGVTTCDALWMGVPVVTLPRETYASRHGFSHLSAVGLAGELVTHNVEEYIARAVELAHNLDRLAELRDGLRERVACSPLCDGERLADELLAALRLAWRAWAGGERIASGGE